MPNLVFKLLILVLGCWVGSANAAKYVFSELGPGAFDTLRVSDDGAVYQIQFDEYSPSAYPADRNSSGQVIGTRTTGSGGGGGVAVLFPTDSHGYITIPFELGTETRTHGFSINDNGDMLGGAGLGRDPMPLQVILKDGSHQHLNVSSYRRPSLNNSLHVVGADVHGGAFLKDESGVHALESLIVNDLADFSIKAPTDISNTGFIVGYGIDSTGAAKQFLLKPSAVLIPAAAWFFGSAILGLGVFRRWSA